MNNYVNLFISYLPNASCVSCCRSKMGQATSEPSAAARICELGQHLRDGSRLHFAARSLSMQSTWPCVLLRLKLRGERAVGGQGWGGEGRKIEFMEIELLCQGICKFRRHLIHVATSATGKALL